MMPMDRPLYYWDTCIFLEHLREEQVDPRKLRAITRILSENKDNKNRIITSVLTHAEAIPKKITATDESNEAKYWSYFDGRRFLDVEVSRPVINLARDIRDYYYMEGDPKTNETYRILGLGDSIHLATAIINNADELHTRDKRNRGGNIGLLKVADLTHDKKIAGQWELKIVDPEDPAGDLFDPPQHQ